MNNRHIVKRSLSSVADNMHQGWDPGFLGVAVPDSTVSIKLSAIASKACSRANAFARLLPPTSVFPVVSPPLAPEWRPRTPGPALWQRRWIAPMPPYGAVSHPLREPDVASKVDAADAGRRRRRRRRRVVPTLLCFKFRFPWALIPWEYRRLNSRRGGFVLLLPYVLSDLFSGILPTRVLLTEETRL